MKKNFAYGKRNKTMAASDNLTWVQCCSCEKWRAVINAESQQFEDVWHCKDNGWDAFNTCSAPQEETNAAVWRLLQLAEKKRSKRKQEEVSADDPASSHCMPKKKAQVVRKAKSKRLPAAVARLQSYCKPGTHDYAPLGKTSEYVQNKLKPREIKLQSFEQSASARKYKRSGKASKTTVTIQKGDTILTKGKSITVDNVVAHAPTATFVWPDDNERYRAVIQRTYVDQKLRTRFDVKWQEDGTVSFGIKPWKIPVSDWSGSLFVQDTNKEKHVVDLTDVITLQKSGQKKTTQESLRKGTTQEAWKFSL